MERRLLAALAIRRPAAVSVESLAEALWTSGRPASARKTIQTNVLRIRSKLGRTAIETVGDRYRLGDGMQVDIERFERAVHEAARSPNGGVARWDAALAWCSEAPLAELRHWPPAEGRRAQLEELRLSAVEARWESALEDQAAADLLPDLEALVAQEPLRERRWSLLLTAYQRAGRRAGGLRAFERARRALAVELGVSPGAELVEAYESLLREDPARVVPSAAGSLPPSDLVSLADRRMADARAAAARGETGAAIRLFVEAASLARDADDARRLAEAALGAAGDGWRTSLDAADEVVLLLTEALNRVPPGPTRLRSRLLARSAIARSHHRSVADCEASATKALAIARALGDLPSIAGALHALTVVVWDPERRAQHRAWAEELLALGGRHPDEPWRRWALPIVARLEALDGGITAACDTLDRLADESSRCADPAGVFAASYADILRASVAGDWPAARAAAAAVRAAADAALGEPGGGSLQELGMLRIFDLLGGRADVGPLAPFEWPTPSMELSVRACYANRLARLGRTDSAAGALRAIDPALDVDHDGYWLATLSMLADAAHLAGMAPIAEVVEQRLRSVTQLTILDPGLIYRGTAAHAAGLAAATCGHRDDARELLSIGLATHRSHRSPWMIERSRQALRTLPGA